MNFHSKKEQPEMGPLGEKRRLWQVELREGGVIGLPEGVSPKDVILFFGNDNRWWAENPSPEILEEIRMWRSDWMDPRGKRD